MGRRSIKTIAGLQRAWDARNTRFARLYKRPYILHPALARHLERFDRLEQINDADARYQEFRKLPSLESELETVDGGLTPKQRESLAQQDRAMRPRARLTEDGQTLESVVSALLNRVDDPRRRKAKEYWIPMVERLRQLGLNPTLVPDPSHLPAEKLEYDGGDGRRSLSLGHFENMVSKARKRFARSFN
jgi:hypothetical protein